MTSGLRFGGTETQVIALAREMRRQGHDVLVYLLTADVPRLAELADCGVEVRTDNKRGKLDLSVLHRLRQAIRDWRPDVVHGFLFDGNVYSRLAGMGLGRVVLNSERNDRYVLRRLQQFIHRPTRAWTQGVIANSHAGAAHARRLFGFAESRVQVVWNGVDVAALRARAAGGAREALDGFFPDGEAGWVAIMVGSITQQKNHLLALDVARRLCTRDARWRVLFVGAAMGNLAYANADAAGSSAYTKEVMARWQGLPPEFRQRIAFAGQRSDVPALIQASDVLFSTSAWEGFPNVVLEAMTLGTPVASSNYSDIRSILPEAWQVAEDADSLADAIERARAGRESLAGAQLAFVDRHCTIEASTRRMLEVYGQYLARRGGRAPWS